MTSNISKKFTTIELIPDLLKSSPIHPLQLAFGAKTVNFGNVLKPSEVQHAPAAPSWPHDAAKLYTLIFTDPDAPSRANPIRREWIHWIVANIPGNDVRRGETIVEFIGSSPGEDTGDHRYTIVVFEQKNGRIAVEQADSEPLKTREGRRHFSTLKFVEKYDLDEIPIAGNYYLASYEKF